MTERRRIYVRPTPADFASDQAIEDLAARLWQAFKRAEGIHITTQLTERYAEAVAYAATALLVLAADFAKGSPMTRRHSP